MPIAKYFNTFELKDPMMITSAILSQFLVVVYAGLMFVLYLESQADVDSCTAPYHGPVPELA